MKNSIAQPPRGDRVNVCSTKHELFRQLTEGSNAPFKTMKDLFLTAAALGARQNTKVPLVKRQGVFAWTQFSPQEDIPFINALVLAVGERLETLLDQGKIVALLEEYANGAIDELANELLATARPSILLANKILDEMPASDT